MAGGDTAMKQTPTEDVVAFLSFSHDAHDHLNAIGNFSSRDWEHVRQWLEDAGLAFYFLQKLKDTNAAGVVPSPVLSRLERNFASNQARVEDMAHRFNAINNEFNNVGVRYVVVKGFSLVPRFCPLASLRHQGDFDYLLDDRSVPAARRVVVEAGYSSQDSVSRNELIFVTPGAKPSRSDEQYSPQAPHAVELHTGIWDSEMHGLQPIPELFSVEEARTRRWNGYVFPAQTDEDAFLLQVLHACRHLFTQWIRMSCLLEIGYFLNQRSSDAELWSGIERRVQDSAILREFVVIATQLASRLFAAPVPRLIKDWEAGIRPGPRVWIENYARKWAFCGLPVYEFSLFPRSKLALFLQQQYRATSAPPSLAPQNRTPSRLSRMASSIKKNPSLLLNGNWWKRQLPVRRSIFYALAEARYLCEVPRWRWLNRASATTSPERSFVGAKTTS
jgi:hypothetical protein